MVINYVEKIMQTPNEIVLEEEEVKIFQELTEYRPNFLIVSSEKNEPSSPQIDTSSLEEENFMNKDITPTKKGE
jgi:hypothetical protein